MSFISPFIDFMFHFDKYIGGMIDQFGILTYAIIFLIIFCEMGLVIMPFLPGDSMIFVLGAFAASGYLNLAILWAVLCAAAILGNSLNYWIGNYFGENVFSRSRFFDRSYMLKTRRFYMNHGSKTIIIARFIPIIRTFAPFVAGVAKMEYRTFFIFNILGGIIWVSLFLIGGYLLGGFPLVRDNLALVTIIVVVVSLVPPIVAYLRRNS